MSPIEAQMAAARACAFYERLTPADLDRLGEIYSPNAYFRDVQRSGRRAGDPRDLREHVRAAGDCRFKILETVADPHGALLIWDMTFRFRRFRPDAVRTIHGASHLKFDAGGRIAHHRDY